MVYAKLGAISAFVLAVASTAAVAQGYPTGRVYSFHSDARGACPGLDWHVVADGSNLTGMISWGQMQHVARVSGKINERQRTFEMTANEVGGTRTAIIQGEVRGDGWLVANITGPDVKCQKVNVRWFSAESGGGGG